MEIKELISGRIGCECGKDHICPIESVVIGEKAFDCLPALVEKYSNILVVADRNTYAVCGEAVEKKLASRRADTLIYSTESVLVPNETAIAELKAHVTQATDLIIGVGSGVINDLCKHVSFDCGLPYYIVATAPSMDGYASKGAALILDGMKVTLNADVPKAIIADVNILKNAPFEMIQAGYGDIIGKYSCLNDWKLANLVNGEYHCEFVMNATYEAVEKTVRLADGLNKRKSDAVCALMEALVAVGILMAYVGNQWFTDNKPHGFDIQDQRLGALLRRTDACRRRILAYTAGKIDRIDELEEELLPYKYKERSINYNNAQLGSTANALL